jgi:hypothetical protein
MSIYDNLRRCTYEKVLVQYYGENSYSFVSDMSMRSSQLSDFDKI